jgi:tannase/feruloyl esterase
MSRKLGKGGSVYLDVTGPDFSKSALAVTGISLGFADGAHVPVGRTNIRAVMAGPQDYDGVVANFPAYNVTMLHLGSLNVGRALYADGGAAWINQKKTKLIADAVVATCDDLDGVKDGVISHVAGCNAALDVKTLGCPNGADTGDTCLSDAQLKAVATITSEYKPGFAIAGADTFGKWALLEGATFQGSSIAYYTRRSRSSGSRPSTVSCGAT